MPVPTEGASEETDESGHLKERERFLDLQHRGAPGNDWRAANNQIMVDAYLSDRQAQRSSMPDGVFAGGKLKGAWFERGSNNQAGSVVGVDYDPESNQIYAISASGSLWRRSLDLNNWTELNRDLQFSRRQIRVIRNSNGGRRLLTAINKKIWYSDDEGATFTPATGLNFTGGSFDVYNQLIATNDGINTGIYYLVMASGTSIKFLLYYSGDYGHTFSLITTISPNFYDEVSLWHPYASGDCYLLNNNNKLYKLEGANLNLLATNNTLPTNTGCRLQGYKGTDGALTFYALVSSKYIYRSLNNGISWEQIGTLPSYASAISIKVSHSDPNKIFYGEVNAYRSFDGGISWQTVNTWQQYYSNIANKLHADIMGIECFRRSNNQEFVLISTDGGLSVSYDFMQTTQNIGLSGLNVSQYYDVRTDPTDPNYVYAGSQDQGFQRATTATAFPLAPLDFKQVVSGDYGHLAFSANGRHLWKGYPGGEFSYYQFPKTANSNWNSKWNLHGTDIPSWLGPTAEYAFNPSANKILVGGGNITGGPGSYLIELTALETSPYTITATQNTFDFHTNSNLIGSYISAIAVNPLNGRYYVATSDGTFFYRNIGDIWHKNSLFNGPDGNNSYGAYILPSKLDSNLVWFCGSGYSNPPVWKSTNGGQTFTAMSNGLPGTLVQQLAASPDEKFIYAATDLGPYVYDVEGNQWFSLRDQNVPLQTVYSVEYIASRNIVRFGTYGRGIWDFAIDNNLIILGGTIYNASCGPGSGEVKLSTAGGTEPLLYSWSDGSTSANPTSLWAGTNTVTVTDANGFTQTQEFYIESGGKPIKPHDLVLPAVSCGPVNLQWQGPNGGSYQIRYIQGNDALWTVVGNVGNVKNYTLNLDPENGLNYSIAVRYVCSGNQQSAWVQLDGLLQNCNLQPNILATERANSTTAFAPGAWRLYPNPARDWVALTFDKSFREIGALRVYDARGTLVRHEKQVALDGNATYKLSLEGLTPGVYFVSADRNKAQKLMIGL